MSLGAAFFILTPLVFLAPFVIVTGGIIVAVVLILALGGRSGKDRAFAALAGQLGLQHRPKDNGDFLAAMTTDLRLFQTGSDRTVKHLLAGRYGQWQVVVCQYEYTTTSTDSEGRTETTTWEHALAMLDMNVFLPKLHIRPENALDRLAAWVGAEDIDFESDRFSRRYFVQADDRRFAYALIDPQMMEFLLSLPDLCWEINGQWVAVHRSGNLEAAHVPLLLNALTGFRQRVPRLATADYGQ